jgi:hypothetical protein
MPASSFGSTFSESTVAPSRNSIGTVILSFL